jgi:hypothetical protein
LFYRGWAFASSSNPPTPLGDYEEQAGRAHAATVRLDQARRQPVRLIQ